MNADVSGWAVADFAIRPRNLIAQFATRLCVVRGLAWNVVILRWQCDREPRPAFGAIVRADLAAVQSHEVLHD